MIGAAVSQAVVRIVGDESHAVSSVRRFNATMEASSRQFNRDFGSIVSATQRGTLIIGAAVAAAGYGISRLNDTYDELVASNRTLDAAAKLTGTSLETLAAFADQARDRFQLGTPQANQFTIAISKLTAKAGDIRRTSEAMDAFINLGAAQGLNAEQTLRAVQQAILGIDEGTDKLFQKNPSVLYAEYAAKIGTTAGKLSDQQKAQALVNAALDAGARVGNKYNEFLDSAAGKEQLLNTRLQETAARLAAAWQPARVTMLEALADGVEGLATTISENEDGIREFFNFLANFAIEGGRSLTDGDVGRRTAGDAGERVREWIGRNATSAAFVVDRWTHGEEQARQNLSRLRNGRGVPGTPADPAVLRRSGFTVDTPAVGLSGPVSPWLAPAPGRPPAETPAFPESPWLRTQREAREAAGAEADRMRKDLFGEEGDKRRPGDAPTLKLEPLNAQDLAIEQAKRWRETMDALFGDRMRTAFDQIPDLELPTTASTFQRRADGTVARLRPENFLPDLRSAFAEFDQEKDRTELTQQMRRNAWLSFAGVGANALVGMSQGGSVLGGAGSLAGAASGLFTGGLSTALGGASIGLSVLQSIFGSSRDREEEAYRAHARALRETRQPAFVVNVHLPSGPINPRDPDWKSAIAATITDLNGTGGGDLEMNFLGTD